EVDDGLEDRGALPERQLAGGHAVHVNQGSESARTRSGLEREPGSPVRSRDADSEDGDDAAGGADRHPRRDEPAASGQSASRGAHRRTVGNRGGAEQDPDPDSYERRTSTRFGTMSTPR